MPVDPALLVSGAHTHLELNYTMLMTWLECKLTSFTNPSTEDQMANDNDTNKRLVNLMEDVREDDFFAQLAVRGSHERFLRGWMLLEEHRHHWELPYYETRDDAQWKQHLEELQMIKDTIGDAKLM